MKRASSFLAKHTRRAIKNANSIDERGGRRVRAVTHLFSVFLITPKKL